MNVYASLLGVSAQPNPKFLSEQASDEEMPSQDALDVDARVLDRLHKILTQCFPIIFRPRPLQPLRFLQHPLNESLYTDLQ